MRRTIFNIVDRLTFNVNKFYNFFMISKDWSYDQLRDYQLQKLRRISDVWNLGIRSWEDFYKLPLTSKEDIFSFTPNTNRRYKTHETSGSTGEPRKVYVPEETWYRKMSIFRRSWNSLGRTDEPVLRLIAGDAKFSWYDYWRNVKALNYRKITNEHVNYLVKEKPFLIHGPGGSTRILIEGATLLGFDDILKDIRIMWLGQSSEIHKERLVDLCKSFHESYGLAELPTVANPCLYNSHMIMETGIVEVIDGEIIVTDFNNDIMPIIRYKTGDEGKIGNNDCPCGMEHPIMYDFKGRRSDYYFGPEVRKPIGWWVVSPISHKYLHEVEKWRVDVYPKKNKFKLYVVMRTDNDPNIILKDYMEWVQVQIGLDCEIVERQSGFKWKRKLVRVIL